MKVDIGLLKSNPDNPRFIKDEKFSRLVQSVKEFPEMLEAREIVVNKDYIILGGNMRYKACMEAGIKEVPIKIVDWSEEKQKEFVIKDNISGGDWDWNLLANDWDTELLEEWGLDLPVGKEKEIEGEIDFTEELNEEHNYIVLYFDNKVDWLNLVSRFDLKSVKALDSKTNFEKKGVGRVVNGARFLNELL